MKKVYKISGMSCNHCVKAVEIELKKLPLDSFSVEIGSAEIERDENKVSDEDINLAIEEAGFKVIN